jgi:hypothetical protein
MQGSITLVLWPSQPPDAQAHRRRRYAEQRTEVAVAEQRLWSGPRVTTVAARDDPATAAQRLHILAVYGHDWPSARVTASQPAPARQRTQR